MNPDQFNFLAPSEVNPTSNLISQRLAGMEQNVGTPTIQTPDTGGVNSAISKAQQILNSEKNAQAVKAKNSGHSGGILGDIESFLPAAAGTLGAIAAAPLDPFTAGLASVAGGALGGSLGQMGENALQGKKVLEGNDVTSGVENAAGVGIGKGLSKGLEVAGDKLAGYGANKAAQMTADREAQDAAQQTVDQAGATKNNFGSIGAPAQKSLDLGGAQNRAEALGLDKTDPQSLLQMSEANKLYGNIYDQELANAPKTADISSLPDEIDKNILSQGSDFGKSSNIKNTATGNYITDLNRQGQALSDDINNAFTKAGLNSSNLKDTSAVSLRQAQQNIGSLIGDSESRLNKAFLHNVSDTIDESRLNVLHKLYGDLQDAIDKTGVSENVSSRTLTPEEEAQAYQDISNRAVAKKAIDTINNGDYEQMKKAMQEALQSGRLGKMAQEDIDSVTASPRALARAKSIAQPTKSLASVLKNPLQSTADIGGLLEMFRGHPLDIIPSMVLHAAKNPELLEGAGKLGTKIASTKIPQVLAQIGANVPNMATSSASQNGGVTNPVTSDLTKPYETALSDALNSLEYAQQYPLMPGSSQSMQAGTQEIGLLVPLLQKLEVTQNALSAATNQYNVAGGGRGGLGGLADVLMSHIPGTQQNAYRNAAQSASAALSGITGTPINLPSLISGQNTAQNIVNNISAQLLGAVPQPT